MTFEEKLDQVAEEPHPSTSVGLPIIRYRFVIYKDISSEWRWNAIALNGEIVATSGEGYKNLTHCTRMVHRLFPLYFNIEALEFVESE